MNIKAGVLIDAPKETVWQIVTNIEQSAHTIDAIEKVEIIERPADSLVGLRWRETRTMFGRTETQEMWIGEAQPPDYYVVRSESAGVVYTSRLTLTGEGDQTRLEMSFEGKPTTFVMRLLAAVTGIFFRGATQKALQSDLEDIKRAAEQRS